MLTIEEGLFHHFTGYTRTNPDIATSLTNTSWKKFAQQELERRKISIMKSFTEEELRAIANGDIDLNDIIRLAADSHK